MRKVKYVPDKAVVHAHTVLEVFGGEGGVAQFASKLGLKLVHIRLKRSFIKAISYNKEINFRLQCSAKKSREHDETKCARTFQMTEHVTVTKTRRGPQELPEGVIVIEFGVGRVGWTSLPCSFLDHTR